MEKFINYMSNLTVSSLNLDVSRTRGRAHREENMEELENHLMNTIDAVNINLDMVSGQMELLKEAVSQYNYLNPMVEPDAQQPQAQADPQAPPPGQAREQKFEPKDSFLSHKRGKVIFDSITMVVQEDDVDLLESYLLSGGNHGSTDLIERYMFTVTD